MGGGGGEGESIRGCFSFSYKKYKWHFYQENLPGGGGGGESGGQLGGEW